jgi:hypothetical protein
VWTEIIGGTAGSDGTPTATDPTDSGLFYFGKSVGRLYRSTPDGGKQCIAGPVPFPLLDMTTESTACMPTSGTVTGRCLGATPILLDPTDTNILFAGCEGLWRKIMRARRVRAMPWSFVSGDGGESRLHLSARLGSLTLGLRTVQLPLGLFVLLPFGRPQAASKRSVHAKQYTVVSVRNAHSRQTLLPHSWHRHTAFRDMAPHGHSPSVPGANVTTGRNAVHIYGSRRIRTPGRPVRRLRLPRTVRPRVAASAGPPIRR